MKKTFLPFLQRDLGGSVGGGGGLAGYKAWVGSGSGGSSTSGSPSSDYDGSSSIWNTVAANAGSTLTGLATLWASIKNQNIAPTNNNYAAPTNAVGGMSTIMIIGIALLLILVLIMAMRPKTQKS